MSTTKHADSVVTSEPEPKTTTKVAAVIGVLEALASAIRDLGRVPSGHLYAQVLGHMSLQTYESMVQLLVESGVVGRDGDVLVWKGKV